MLARQLKIICMILVLTMLSVPVFSARHQKPVSQNQAVAIARDQVHGRVLSATTQERGGRQIHNVRILSDGGRVRNLRIDAISGEVLRKRPRKH